MDIKFIGPARLSADGGVEFPATVNMENIICYFSYECLEDLDPEDLIGDALVHFTKHQLKLLQSQKINYYKVMPTLGELRYTVMISINC